MYPLFITLIAISTLFIILGIILQLKHKRLYARIAVIIALLINITVGLIRLFTSE
ncbi:MAG: hypothetical protein K0S80_4845 [Neobacillus sp.]|jgi:hypothetical protein|nr:hypothetical protein [Neobacillus sp.]